MKIVGLERVKGKPTLLQITVSDSAKNIREMARPYGMLHELQATGAKITIEER
jgi:hypothetical protein